ncbi:MAG TPA: hydroxysqualene dehydroxylase HpnE [Candidatus Dormibacteraeota bacterium]|nr:hydroxysqualene dehydroxylase HpnE [Candidatus Dormibacteraeota bacterium]
MSDGGIAGARVAVVGAGLAGLAAGVELAARGCDVVLCERSRLLGGKTTSFRVGDVEVDSGQHVHLACCTEYVDFVGSVGMGDALWLQERFEAVVLRSGERPARLRAGRLPAPLHLAASFARYAPLGLRARLEVARALLAVRRPGPARPGETVAGWLRRHGQGAQATEAFWEPFMVPALNAPLAEASADDFLFTIRTAFLADAGAARFGWSRVPLARIAEAAAMRLAEVRLRTAVTGLLGGPADPGGPDRVQGVRLAGGDALQADAVVLAVPPSRLAGILVSPEALGVAGLDALRPEPIVDVHLWYEPAALPEWEFAAILASPLQWVFRKSAGYLCCSMSAAREAVKLPEAELVDLCARELEAAEPRLRGIRPVRGGAVRDPEATIVAPPGRRRPGPATAAPNVVLAGAWTDTGWPATMESAVRSGRAAARLVRSRLERVRHAA